MTNSLRKFCFILYSIFLTTTAMAGALNSAIITADTLAALPNCLHYEIKGTCFWLTQTGEMVSTPYVQHHLPDVVVSIFNKPGDNPWLEINATLDVAGQAAQTGIVSLITGVPAGGGQHSFQNPFEQHVFFKEVDVIGNPALPALPTTPVLLRSAAVPMMPYFQSLLDSALWRGFPPLAVPEQVYAYGANVKHIIGSLSTAVWGGAYPPEGKIFAGNDAKAGAVAAQRAANLLTTRMTWGHLVQPLPTHCGSECEAAIIQENSDQTQFQAIYPLMETTCSAFGKSADYGENVKTPANGAYAWVLWRQYHGCVPAPPGSTFLYKLVI